MGNQFDYDDGDFIFNTSSNIAFDSDGNMMMRMSENMAMDMDSENCILHLIGQTKKTIKNLSLYVT